MQMRIYWSDIFYQEVKDQLPFFPCNLGELYDFVKTDCADVFLPYFLTESCVEGCATESRFHRRAFVLPRAYAVLSQAST